MEDLRELTQHQAQFLIGLPLTKHKHLKNVRLPSDNSDEYGVPPVVVWMGNVLITLWGWWLLRRVVRQ